MTVAGQKQLTAYELQVLIGTTISGCNMSPDRTFDLPAAWARLKGLGLIDRADGIANATPAGVELVASILADQHRREAEAGDDVPVRNDDIAAASILYQCADCVVAEADYSCHNRDDVFIIGGKVICRDCADAGHQGEQRRAVPDIAAKLKRQRMAIAHEQRRFAASPSSPASGVRVKALDVLPWRYDLEAVPRDRDFLIQFDHKEVTIGRYLDNSKSPWPYEGIQPCRTMRPNRVGEKIVAWREMPAPDTQAPALSALGEHP